MTPLAAIAAFSTVVVALFPPVAAGASLCQAASAAERNTLVELFTSEGCSSCPPADAWLSRLKGQAGVVPLAFHVDYWDRLGWVDRFADAAYTRHQEHRRALGGLSYLFTPQIVVNGQTTRLGASRALAPAGVPGADLQVAVSAAAAGLHADVAVRVRAGQRTDGAQAWLAVSENGLTSEVRAGENAGNTLRHDFVVREWYGPFAVPGTGVLNTAVALRRTRIAGARVTVFVERGADILQALAVDCS